VSLSANQISAARIFLSLALLLVEPLGVLFFIIYFLCGFSDFLDGYIARKTGTTSKFGEKLDSLADLVMVFILLYALYPLFQITALQVAWLIAIVILRGFSVIVTFVKFKTFAILHTYGNKLTGLLLFIMVPLLVFVDSGLLINMLCLTGSVSAVEELLIQLTSKELKVNRRSLLTR
jgi:CDP-diacylglycerol--glycerol-3-phosphate 3-phosphatidyltransferase